MAFQLMCEIVMSPCSKFMRVDIKKVMLKEMTE